MKLINAEIAAIVITLIFISVTIIASLGNGDERAAATISASSSGIVNAPDLQAFSSQTPKNSPQVIVNINTASETELCSLSGIGKTLAARIIAFRDEHGLFNSSDEIMSVAGIGAKTYGELKSYITVD